MDLQLISHSLTFIYHVCHDWLCEESPHRHVANVRQQGLGRRSHPCKQHDTEGSWMDLVSLAT